MSTSQPRRAARSLCQDGDSAAPWHCYVLVAALLPTPNAVPDSTAAASKSPQINVSHCCSCGARVEVCTSCTFNFQAPCAKEDHAGWHRPAVFVVRQDSKQCPHTPTSTFPENACYTTMAMNPQLLKMNKNILPRGGREQESRWAQPSSPEPAMRGVCCQARTDAT